MHPTPPHANSSSTCGRRTLGSNHIMQIDIRPSPYPNKTLPNLVSQATIWRQFNWKMTPDTGTYTSKCRDAAKIDRTRLATLTRLLRVAEAC